jgi:hypothetical protein
VTIHFHILSSNEALTTALHFSAQSGACYVTHRHSQGSLNCNATIGTVTDNEQWEADHLLNQGFLFICCVVNEEETSSSKIFLLIINIKMYLTS